ncbi:MAG: RibD family protein [Rhodospirillaceae bacterium]|nr:RibD family protein [Rhodospirillaceae bacterium]
MDSIVDWESDTPQWSAVLNAAASCDAAADLAGNSLWPLYAPLARIAEDQSFVIGQLGQSLDGRIATPSGHSHYINGPAALVHLHRLRALVDAVVVGVGTVVADNPQLNVRRVTAGKTKPARVILDPHGRMPANAACLAADSGPGGARRIVVRCSDKAPAFGAGVESITVPAADGAMPPTAILAALRGLGLRRVLIEGGAKTLSRFLAADLLDRLHIMTGPLIIGSGSAGIQLPAIVHLDQALKPAVTTYLLPGGDVLSDCAFR